MSNKESILTNKDLVERLNSWYSEQETPCLEFIERLVDINSYSANFSGVNEVQDILQEELATLGLETERSSFENSGDTLVGVVPGDWPEKSSVLLVGHSDTVHPPDSGFSGLVIDGDKAIGPGSVDMKGGLAVIVWALRALSDLGVLHKIPVRVYVSPDEEVASAGSKHVCMQQSELCRSVLVFEWGRDNNNLVTRRRGIAVWEVEVFGKSGHAGNAHKQSANAVERISHFVYQLSQLTDHENLTVNVGKIQGGTATNTVPDYAAATFEVRFNTVADYEPVKNSIADLVSQDIVEGTQVKPREVTVMPALEETPESVNLVETLTEAGNLLGIDYNRMPNILGGGSDANHAASVGTPAIDGLGPFGDGAHTENEYMLISSLKPKILTLATWLYQQHISN